MQSTLTHQHRGSLREFEFDTEWGAKKKKSREAKKPKTQRDETRRPLKEQSQKDEKRESVKNSVRSRENS